MLVYAAESISKTENSLNDIKLMIEGLNGTQLRELIRNCGKKEIEMMSDEELAKCICEVGTALGAIKENTIYILKILRMCDTCITLLTNKVKCNDNTWHCYKKVENMQIQPLNQLFNSPHNKTADFCTCVVERKTLDMVDK
ncbi:uncharacterized protein LOC114944335 isoform X3 [Nylanderia fulva]|nr:uncharacterized protein LOC114944335 isoform X3 [Nylanderia fulva]